MGEEERVSIITAMIDHLEKQVKEREATAGQVKKQGTREEILEARAIVEVTRDEIENYRELEQIKKVSEVGNLSISQIDKAMSFTCYRHFAGCCGPEARCPTHLCVCEALGLDPEDVFKVKKDAVDAWLKRLLKTRVSGI